MNTLLAVAVGGILLFVIGRSLFRVWNSTEMNPNDRRAAAGIVVAILLAFVATVLIVHPRG
jgi:hypothetical protein